MKIVALDTNIFDKLAVDASVKDLISTLCTGGAIRLIISRTVRDELASSPHNELLLSLPIELVGNATPIAGLMCAGDYLGDVEHFIRHKGESSKVNDAQVANSAELLADWLVSEDSRLRRRQQKFSTSVEVLTYDEFVQAVRELAYVLDHRNDA